MTKEDVQKRVLWNGKVLPLNKFEWDRFDKIFKSKIKGLIIDFSGIDGVTFKTGSNCILKTGDYCNIHAGWDCMFHTGSNCNFKTGNYCNFNTSYGCIFNAGCNSIFETNGENCIIIRYDIHEIVEVPVNKKIKLNGFQQKGYTILNNDHTIIIDGKEIKLSEESYNNLKEQFK
jgi:hypothetical protein